MLKKKGSISISFVTVLFFIILISFSILLLLESMYQKSITYTKYVKNNYNYVSNVNKINNYIYSNDILTDTTTIIDNKNINIQVLNTNKSTNIINNITIEEFKNTYTTIDTNKYLIVSNNNLQIKDDKNNEYNSNFVFLSNSNLILTNLNTENKYVIKYNEGQFFIVSVSDINNKLEKKYLIYKSYNYVYKVLEF